MLHFLWILISYNLYVFPGHCGARVSQTRSRDKSGFPLNNTYNFVLFSSNPIKLVISILASYLEKFTFIIKIYKKHSFCSPQEKEQHQGELIMSSF